jgi:zinc and cadmium transporter
VADTPSPKKLEATADGSTEKGCLENWKGKGSAGYMNLVGSLIHNFMDGLTIGLGFATGDKYVYIPIVIAVFAHEIPRELGDVAILLESKFNNKQTIISNGVINLISIIGAIIGLAVVGTSEEVQTYIMVFVAGNFMYIAADIWRHLFKAKWLGNLMQQIFFAIGVGAMFGIKFLEDAPLVA